LAGGELHRTAPGSEREWSDLIGWW